MVTNTKAIEPSIVNPEFIEPVVRVFYIRDSNKFPVACVAYTQVTADEVAYGLSIHNPKDSFNKVLGRSIAIGRLEKSKEDEYIGLVKESDKHLIEASILSNIETKESIPVKIRKEAFRNVEQFYKQREANRLTAIIR